MNTPTPTDQTALLKSIDQKLAELEDDFAPAACTAPASTPATAPSPAAPAAAVHTRDRDPAHRAAWKRERAIALGILKP